MHQTWKCDFCSDTNTDPKKIEAHEKQCFFNPDNKGCYTCKFCYEDGAPIGGFYNSCEKGLHCYEGEEGNCHEWVISDKLTTEVIKSKLKEF